jgi:hypothetical protein
MATDKPAPMEATRFSMGSDPSLHAIVEGTVVFYEVCSEATTANATVGVFFVVCSQTI